MILHDSSGKNYQFEDKPIREGGEAFIYQCSLPNIIAKVFKSRMTNDKIQKYQTMINDVCNLSSEQRNYILEHCSIPLKFMYDTNNCIVGYIMKKFINAKNLQAYLAGEERQIYLEDFYTTLAQKLVQTLRNIYGILPKLNSLGDISLNNFMVDFDGKNIHIRIIDTNGWDYDHYHCYSYTPGFSSPERVQKERSSRYSDLFSIGIITHFILTNNNPYLNPGGKDIQTMINKGISPIYQINIPINKLIGVVEPKLAFCNELYDCLRNIFIHYNSPSSRGTFEKLENALDKQYNSLKKCYHCGHLHPSNKKCYLCEISHKKSKSQPKDVQINNSSSKLNIITKTRLFDTNTYSFNKIIFWTVVIFCSYQTIVSYFNKILIIPTVIALTYFISKYFIKKVNIKNTFTSSILYGVLCGIAIYLLAPLSIISLILAIIMIVYATN